MQTKPHPQRPNMGSLQIDETRNEGVLTDVTIKVGTCVDYD